MTDPIDIHDKRSRRCPMLGHDVSFSYCRQPAADLPCRRVLDCWWETFDVEAFLRAHLDEQTLQRMLAPRQDKMTSLVELIQRAREAQHPGDSPDESPEEPAENGE